MSISPLESLTTLSSSTSPVTINNEFKSRNILNLEQRIKVIRHYEHSVHQGCPCTLQSLANKFCCSAKQIKNILRNRANIVRTYKSSMSTELNKDDAQQSRRVDKIRFLGKVIYEYIERAVYHRFPINTIKVCSKATEVKECIAIENFIVTRAWLNNFQTQYGLPSFDLKTLCNNVMIYEPKQPQLNAIDLIQYVTRKEQEQQQAQQQHQTETSKLCEAVASPQISDNSHNYCPSNKKPLLEEKKDILNCYEGEINNKDELSNKQTETTLQVPHSSKCLPDIKTLDQALLHIKALQEFAMLRDHYRAIGILSQLEILYKKESNAS